jgi:hypothetical protein
LAVLGVALDAPAERFLVRLEAGLRMAEITALPKLHILATLSSIGTPSCRRSRIADQFGAVGPASVRAESSAATSTASAAPPLEDLACLPEACLRIGGTAVG